MVTVTKSTNTPLDIDLGGLPRSSKIQLFELLNEYDTRLKYNKLHTWFPDSGTYSRSLYRKSLQFFKAGAEYKTRVIFGGNRSGKSTSAHFEVALHATGLYPDWWEGARFDDPKEIWCCADTQADVRDIAQTQLCGNTYDLGTGMIPKHLILDSKAKAGTANALDHILVRHTNGGIVKISFKAYEQGRKAFQGRSVEFIVIDEECPQEIFGECLSRTMTVSGKVVFSFTPLSGLTPLVLQFLPNGKFPENHKVPGESTWVINIEWDDVPHLSEEDKKTIAASFLPHEREARTKGFPSIGSGRVYTAPEKDFVIEPFNIPYSWPKCYGLDIALFGDTACVWLAYDEDQDIVYLYDCYKASSNILAVHAEALRRRGNWIPGAIDPSAKRRKEDGKQWVEHYLDLGLDVRLADNSVEAGITTISNRLIDGRFRVFASCTQWLEEYRIYRFDNKKEIAKNQKDDLMDATRYAIMTGLSIARTRPEEKTEKHLDYRQFSRDPITGY